ncbi:MAG: bifunctional 4-hydroxy-2-oxoglutarate aldolase/2-dehydro-3-deoxy-phosphogluconate aldolase [Candidatus Gastranaerophilaceae bacterium]
MNENLIDILKEEKIFPILRSNDAKAAVDTAKALIDGGIKILEVNVENPSIYEAITEISKYADVCAGGIITSMQAQAAITAGARILSSPIFHMNLVKISKDKQIPYVAGTSTANEAYSAWKSRIPLIKIYPITAMGGAMYVEDLLRPMPFLDIMPIGNVKLDEVHSYIKAGASAVGVGRDFYDGYSYKEITDRARKIVSELKG